MEFLKKMEDLLQEDYPKFISSYNCNKSMGLRANTLKISAKTLTSILPYLNKNIPWCSDGFYYEEPHRPAKSPHYHCGLYYIQEPSAMYPAEALGVQEGDIVLDLCAAPGGKSVQIGSKLRGFGLLIVNDINTQRAKVLLKNIEKYGIKNAVVLNDTPDKISAYFKEFFDKILVDAPCSGEGMFRKDPDMIKNWSEGEVSKYAHWQKNILQNVPPMLAKNGTIVYSTCTFSPEENEQQVNNLLLANPSFNLWDLKRLWPHEINGEGHFIATIVQGQSTQCNHFTNTPSQINLPKESLQALEEFCSNIWNNKDYYTKLLPPDGKLLERKGHILWEHNLLPTLSGLKVLRSGWLIGMVEKNRFKPSQALAMGLKHTDVESSTQNLNLSSNNEVELGYAYRYLKGETIQVDGVQWSKGWYLISLDGYPLGWAKSAQFTLKNHYPPGWLWVDGEKEN